MEEMQHIWESEKKLAVIGAYDVVVAGGGIAGIAAALAATRKGKKVLLLERMYTLGGLATLGLITIYLPLCDGKGRQVCYGIAEELFHLSIKHGHEAGYPTSWINKEKEHGTERYQVQYNPQIFAILAEQLLVEHGVTILYGTSVCDVIVEHKRVEALVIENKSGRSAVRAKTVVDATGDADVCVLAGEQTRLYAAGNTMAAWFYETIDGENKLRMVGASDIPSENEKPIEVVSKRISGIEAKELSERMIESHQKSLEIFLRNGSVSQKHSLTTLATIPQLRMTRRIVGSDTLGASSCVNLSDSIGMVGDWRMRGPIYEIPFGSLHGDNISNLIVAGRCISVTDDIWDVTRVIPACALTGQAAGTAAAMTDNFNTLDVGSLQSDLVLQGVVLHECDISGRSL